MYLLDTNIIRYSLYHPQNYPNLIHKIRTVPRAQQFISIVTVEELLEFRLGPIRERTRQQSKHIVDAYEKLGDLIQDFRALQIAPFSESAYRVFQELTAVQTRIGTNDRRIAATALSLHYPVVTANIVDFERVTALSIEDWTRP